MKKKTFHRIMSCALTGLLVLSCAACGNKEEEKTEQRVLTAEEITALGDKVPNYSQYTHQFDFFGYSSLETGVWTEDGTEYFAGEDFRNYARIVEYKESGLNVVMPQTPACVDEHAGLYFDFESSMLKQVMDWSVEAGVPQVMVTDYRLYVMCDADGLVGEGKQIGTEDELDALVRQYMEPYAEHEAFWGLQLLDEPKYFKFPVLGELYKSIKRCYPEAEVIMNLLPPLANVKIGEMQAFQQPTEEEIQAYIDRGYYGNYAERYAAFAKYLNMFLDATGAPYICYDQYPLGAGGVGDTYVGGLQVAAEVAKERGVEFYLVTQTYSDKTGVRMLSNEDLRWLNNMSLGFGVKKLGYFTYFNRGEFADGCSFITLFGDKTQIYYDMQKVFAENQKFAPVIMNFDYQTSATYIKPLSRYNSTHISTCVNGTFAKVASFENDKESTLVTELYDDDNNRYMYMIHNSVDSAYKSSDTYQTTTVTFNEAYAYAVVWKNGEQSVVKLVDNKYTVSQHPGEAVFVLPFNA